MKFRAISGKTAFRAYDKALFRVLADPLLHSAANSAGYVVGPSGVGVQVFVQVERFDKRLLKLEPVSGGLVSRASRRSLRKLALMEKG